MNIQKVFETDKTQYQIKLSHSAPWKSVQLLHGIVLTRHWHPISESETIDIYKPIQNYVDIERIPNTEIAMIELPQKEITIINRKDKSKRELIQECVDKDLGISTILLKKTKIELLQLLELGDIDND